MHRRDSTSSRLKGLWILARPLVHSFKVNRCPPYQLPDPLPDLSKTLQVLSLGHSVCCARLIDILRLLPNVSDLALSSISFGVHMRPEQSEFGQAPVNDPPPGGNILMLRIDDCPSSLWDALLQILPNLGEASCGRVI